MKLTPLLLFLLLLVVLVIAVSTLKNPIAPVEKEGFVQFNANIKPQVETVIPPYSKRKIVKLYDNLYIDRQNMNIVEVVSSQFTGNIDASTFTGNIDASTYVVSSGNVDATGTSISAINIQSRDGVITNSRNSTAGTIIESNESKIASITSSYKSPPVYTTTCTTTATYQLFYIPWGPDTYIHGIQTSANPGDTTTFKPLNIFSYYIPSDQAANMTATYYNRNDPRTQVNLTVPTTTDNSLKNNSLVIDGLYSATKQIYQLSADVKYDIQSGNLIVNSSSASIIVYDRSGKSTTYSSTPNNSDISAKLVEGKSPWFVNNISNTLQIVYMASRKNTVILLIKVDASGKFSIFNMARFSEYGLDKGITNYDDSGPSDPDGKLDKASAEEYYKWYWYWNSTGLGNTGNYSNNYLLKTQIVPPVCPACPSTCSSSNNSNSGKSNDGNIINNAVGTTGNVINKTVDTTGNVINKTVDTTSDLLKSGASGATDLVKSGASGATDLVKSGASGATNLVKSGVSGTADLVKSGVSGLVNTTGNVLNALTDDSNALGGNGQYYGGLNTPYGGGRYGVPGFSQGSPPNDSYSYYGALANKRSNYIPITADFSAFSK